MFNNNILIILNLITIVLLVGCDTDVTSREELAHSEPPVNATELSWYQKYPQAVLASDHTKNLYQLRVIQQKHNECSMHQKRNLLFAMAMFENDCAEFASEYQRLIDVKLFETMALNSTCELEDTTKDIFNGRIKHGKPVPNETRTRREPKIKKLVQEAVDFVQFLPQKSPVFLGQISIYSRYINDSYFVQLLTMAKDTIPRLESDRPVNDNVAFDAADLTKNGYSWLRANDKIVEVYKRLNARGNFLLPISLNLNSVGNIYHATSILIKKFNGKLEFIFMDPLNWQATTTEAYAKIIDGLIRFANDPNYFKESLIRSGYITSCHQASLFEKRILNDPKFKPYSLFTYLELIENLELKTDPFFVRYYQKPTCQLIEQFLAGAPIAAKLKRGTYNEPDPVNFPDAKAELLSRFSCR